MLRGGGDGPRVDGLRVTTNRPGACDHRCLASTVAPEHIQDCEHRFDLRKLPIDIEDL